MMTNQDKFKLVSEISSATMWQWRVNKLQALLQNTDDPDRKAILQKRLDMLKAQAPYFGGQMQARPSQQTPQRPQQQDDFEMEGIAEGALQKVANVGGGVIGAGVGATVGGLAGATSYKWQINKLKNKLRFETDPNKKYQLAQKIAHLESMGRSRYAKQRAGRGAVIGGAVGGIGTHAAGRGITRMAR